jgi:hypothetical protein
MSRRSIDIVPYLLLCGILVTLVINYMSHSTGLMHRDTHNDFSFMKQRLNGFVRDSTRSELWNEYHTNDESINTNKDKNNNMAQQMLLASEGLGGMDMNMDMGFGATSASVNDVASDANENNNENNANTNKGFLNCDAYGGPSNEFANAEMNYWHHIPSDTKYSSPFKKTIHTEDNTQQQHHYYLTFEPDSGGWNNIRMAMETVLVLAHAMGRTLVLPPEERMYLLGHGLEFQDFFNIEHLSEQHAGIDIISMQEFLTRQQEIGTGTMVDTETQEPVSLPNNGQVTWDNTKNVSALWAYLRQVGETRFWDPRDCQVGFPKNASPDSGTTYLEQMMAEIQGMTPKPEPSDYQGKPVPVDASPLERLKASLAGDRYQFCYYDHIMQDSILVHIPLVPKQSRMLVHFYSFLYFEDWTQDLFYKRFIRDYIRYKDELTCAAARIVEAVRERAKLNTSAGPNPNGEFDAFHIRRGDFQYKKTRVSADVIYDISHTDLTEGATVYIATDERDKSFFTTLASHYDVVYLSDYLHLIPDLDTHYYGMMDQLVASKSRVFVGTWFSSFSGYINRLRGYYVDKHKLPGYEDGSLQSFYFAPAEKRDEMRTFWPSRKPFYMREFPPAWRDIDHGVPDVGVDVNTIVVSSS